MYFEENYVTKNTCSQIEVPNSGRIQSKNDSGSKSALGVRSQALYVQAYICIRVDVLQYRPFTLSK